MNVMRNVDIKIILLNILSTAAICIFLIYTLIQIQVITRSPFNLEQYTEITVSLTEPMSQEDTKRISKELWIYLQQQKIGTIIQNMDALGLALYDPQQKYAPYSLASGHYFPKTLLDQNNVILARQGSFIDKYSQAQNHTYEIEGKSYHVIGNYSPDYPLYTENTDYIIPLDELEDIRGTYFLSTRNNEQINNVVAMLEDKGVNVSIASSSFKKSASYIINQLVHTTTYIITCMGVVFIFGNFYVFYLFYLLKFRKSIRIYRIFGGTSFSIIIRSYHYVFLNILAGSFLGTSVYLFFLDFGKLSFSITIFLGIILINTIISSLLYVFAFHGRIRTSKLGGEI
jgi:hypothetical protein